MNKIKNSAVKYANSESELEREMQSIRTKALSNISGEIIAQNPLLYIDRRLFTTILTKIKMFEKIIEIQGLIVECGVYRGGRVMTYYHLSSIFEPYSINRKIIGFDSFEGFPSKSKKDPSEIPVGAFRDTNMEHILEWAEIHDKNRPVGHVPKLQLIKGDACKTIPKFVEENPHLIIAHLYLDFDLYEPTAVALKYFLPLIPKGGVVGFDEINRSKWAGETVAVKEYIGLSNIRLKRFYFDAHVSYYIVE